MKYPAETYDGCTKRSAVERWHPWPSALNDHVASVGVPSLRMTDRADLSGGAHYEHGPRSDAQLASVQ